MSVLSSDEMVALTLAICFEPHGFQSLCGRMFMTLTCQCAAGNADAAADAAAARPSRRYRALRLCHGFLRLQ